MSGGYASRLKKGVDYGVCGLPELFDPPRLLAHNINRLVSLLNSSDYVVVFTGAGISTSCGISDFRGPKGIWTKEQEKEREEEKLEKQMSKKAKTSKQSESESPIKESKEEIETPSPSPPPKKDDFRFEDAHPSLTHMALVGLVEAKKIKFIVTQNVDNIHYRSGVKRELFAELHGNVMGEKCEKCKKVYYRNFDVKGIGFNYTGRLCDDQACQGKLRDVLLDWDSPLPQKEYNQAKKHCSKADLVLCLGTSLRVQPANAIPELAFKNNGKLVICNLQKTPKDPKAELLVRTRCDYLMKEVMRRLGMRIPVYRRTDTVEVSVKHVVTTKQEQQSDSTSNVSYQLSIMYPNGIECAFIDHIEIVLLRSDQPGIPLGTSDRSPFLVEWEGSSSENSSFELEVTIYFTSHFNQGKRVIRQKVDGQQEATVQQHTFETAVIDYNEMPSEDSRKEEQQPDDMATNGKKRKRD